MDTNNTTNNTTPQTAPNIAASPFGLGKIYIYKIDGSRIKFLFLAVLGSVLFLMYLCMYN